MRFLTYYVKQASIKLVLSKLLLCKERGLYISQLNRALLAYGRRQNKQCFCHFFSILEGCSYNSCSLIVMFNSFLKYLFYLPLLFCSAFPMVATFSCKNCHCSCFSIFFFKQFKYSQDGPLPMLWALLPFIEHSRISLSPNSNNFLTHLESMFALLPQ